MRRTRPNAICIPNLANVKLIVGFTIITPITEKISHVVEKLDGNLESLTLKEIKSYANILSKAGKNLKLVHKCLLLVESDKSDGDA